MTRIGIGLLVAITLMLGFGRRALMITSTATPLGRPVRVGDAIITMMARREPYMVSLHRASGKDRYAISLLIRSARDTSVQELMPIVTGQRAVPRR